MEKDSAIDFQRMRADLIKIYEDFLKNPADHSAQEKAVSYEADFGGLSVYNDYLQAQPVPKDINFALEGLSAIYQYGIWGDTHEAFSKDKILSIAKKSLEELKKFLK